MNLEPTVEQLELVAGARRFLAAELPVTTLERDAGAEVGAGASAGADLGAGASAGAAWRQMAQLGWFAIGMPVQRNGAGGSLADQALVFRELGRGLAPGPLLGTALGAWVAILGGRDDLASSLMAGETSAALAEPWRDRSAAVAIRASVSGRFRVLDAGEAALVTVVTPTGACLVRTEVVNVTARELPAPDPSVGVCMAELNDVPTEAMLHSSEHADFIVARGQVLTTALLVGILEAVLDMSVAHVSTRQQFGKPIGSFQAVKHRCADMAVRAEAAGSLLWLAALSLEGTAATAVPASSPAPAALGLAASAKALASEYAVASAHDNVQNHGGMGFTAECPAHLYVKRALEWSVTMGSSETLLAAVAR
jgi:alkylation response protein AidB-like acyl-CoA dehydrogenase